MSFSIVIAAVVFLASVILSQKIAVDAASRLDDATKLKISEVFPGRNIVYTAIVFAIVIVFLLAMYLYPEQLPIIMVGYAIVFGIYLIAKLILNVRKLKEIGAPAEYTRSVIISFGVFIGGAVVAGIVASIKH